MKYYRIYILSIGICLVLSITVYLADDALKKALKLENDLKRHLQITCVGINNTSGYSIREVSADSHVEKIVSTKEPVIIRCGDSMSKLMFIAGNPIGSEKIDELVIYKYEGCNIVVKDGFIIGWSIKKID